MPTLHVKRTFEIPERQLFVLVSSITDGEVRPGMFIRAAPGTKRAKNILIDKIESTLHAGGREICVCGSDYCVCIWAGQKYAEILRGLKLAGQSFVVEHAELEKPDAESAISSANK